MIFGPITFIQISRSRGGENFGGDTGEDTDLLGDTREVTEFYHFTILPVLLKLIGIW